MSVARSARLRAPWVVPVSAIAVFAATTFAIAVRSSASAPALTVRVVEPDGSPVQFPVALVSVLGRTYTDARTVRGGALGDLTVPVPVDDPVAAERLAAGDPVNLLIRVFDKAPSSSDINAAYITAAVGVDAVTGLVGDLSGITGQVFKLQPGLTAFQAVHFDTPKPTPPQSYPPPTVPSPVGSALPKEDEPACPHNPPGSPVPCYLVDYPDWSYNTYVPIAENFGAGADMYATMAYKSTVVTQTTAAMRVGKIGFFQSQGSVAYEKSDAIGLGFNAVGHGETDKAYLVTQMERTRSGACMRDFSAPGKPWYCQLETMYRPYLAHGADTSPGYANQDALIKGRDCYSPVTGYYDKGRGKTRTIRFELTLGPSENWATLNEEPGLWAQTTVTGQTFSGESHIRRWDVDDNPTFMRHYLYVQDGLLNYDATKPGTPGDGACVENNIPLALTEATDVNLADPGPGPGQPSVTPPDAEGTFCGRMPDRCD
jgi:hypothetical protein